METINWVEISAIAVAALVAIALIILLKRGWITKETVEAAEDLLDSLPMVGVEGFIEQLYNYCRLAVRAVEQMTKAGVLPKENAARKEEAVQHVITYAEADGIEISDNELSAINTLIEAAVLELPKTEEQG